MMMVTPYRKPLPIPNEDTKPFWEGCKRHELLMKRCSDCGAYRFYPDVSVTCPQCLSTNFTWEKVSGRGTVYTFGIVRHSRNPGWAAELPYIIALVELEEGPRLFSNIVEVDHQEVHIGMPVAVVFEDVTAEITLPKFRPVRR